MYAVAEDFHSELRDPGAAYVERGLHALPAPEEWSEASMAEWLAGIEDLMKVFDVADEEETEQSEKEVRAQWRPDIRVALDALEKESGGKGKESTKEGTVADEDLFVDAPDRFNIEGVGEEAVNFDSAEPNTTGLDVVTMRWFYLQHLTQPIVQQRKIAEQNKVHVILVSRERQDD